MARKPYVCPYHGVQVWKWCQLCLAEYKNLPDVDTMTVEEKAEEVRMWLYDKHTVTMPFENWPQRIAKILGRPVFSLEMLGKNKEVLIAEAKGLKKPPQYIDEIIQLLPDRLRENVQVVNLDDDGSREFSAN